MDDKAFTELALKASICPSQSRWPKPEVEFSTRKDDKTITATGLHWSRAADGANWLREVTSKALADLAAVDADQV